MPSELKRQGNPLSKVVQFHIVKNLTDPQPTIVRRERSADPFPSVRLILKPEVLNNDSKLQEILWNFSRFDPERCLTLSQNPHFYHLPTLPNADWS